jgi:hypothetical protein
MEVLEDPSTETPLLLEEEIALFDIELLEDLLTRTPSPLVEIAEFCTRPLVTL